MDRQLYNSNKNRYEDYVTSIPANDDMDPDVSTTTIPSLCPSEEKRAVLVNNATVSLSTFSISIIDDYIIPSLK